MMTEVPLARFDDSARLFPRRKFTLDEDNKLRALVDSFGTESWQNIARFVPQRTARQCRDRYNNYLVDSLMTDPWTPEEDALVIQQYHRIGAKWVEIGKMLKGRSGNNVKNRWHKHLCRVDPTLLKLTPAASQPPLPPIPEAPAEVPTPFVPEPVPSGDGGWTSGLSIEDSLF
jgi:hypothetical protein